MEIVLILDKNEKGGSVIKPKQNDVFVNGELVITTGDDVIYKNIPPTKTGIGSTSVFINGISINRKGDVDLDGSIRLEHEASVRVG